MKTKRLAAGVEQHGNKIRIRFSYEGAQHRMSLAVTQIDKNSIRYARNKLASVQAAISEGRFSWQDHFPGSRQALEGVRAGITVGECLQQWLSIRKARCARSTFLGYKSHVKLLQDYYEHWDVGDLTKIELERFQAGLLKTHSPKTINNIIKILRNALDDVLEKNPADRLRSVESDHQNNADPFTTDELDLLSSTPTHCPQGRNMLLFACWSGLSVSEVMALAWEDVDLLNGLVQVRRAVVCGRYKVPKERSRARSVELLDQAQHYLKRQQKHTRLIPPASVEVVQRNNVFTISEQCTWVFRGRPNGEPWRYSHMFRDDFLKLHFQNAGVRPRGANQARHTFASRMVSAYAPMEWVALQMGHTDTTMIRRHYGKFLPKEAPRIAKDLSVKLETDRR